MSAIVTVPFHGDELFAVETDGQVFVALKPIVLAIGLVWHGQFERIKRDPILSEGVRAIRIPSAGGPQEATGLRLDLLSGWLFTIDANRVREAVRDRVILYQRECYAALHSHFHRPPSLVAETPRLTAPMDWPMGLAEHRALVTECRHTYGRTAARELWAQIGLPVTPSMLRAGVQPGGASPGATLEDWFETCCRRDPAHRTVSGALYKSYRLWCDRAGAPPLNETSFGRALSEMDIGRHKSNGSVWRTAIELIAA
jgi:hypothetical protein